jgi:hypothetical protein
MVLAIQQPEQAASKHHDNAQEASATSLHPAAACLRGFQLLVQFPVAVLELFQRSIGLLLCSYAGFGLAYCLFALFAL